MKKLLVLFVLFATKFTLSYSQTSDLGIKHNQVVAYLDSYDFTGKTQDDLLKDVTKYTVSLYNSSLTPPTGDVNFWGEVWLCATGGGFGDTKSLTYDNVINVLLQKGQISTESKDFLTKLVSETEQLTSYNKVIEKVNELEKNYGIDKLGEQEKLIIQGAISVYKNSASYWNNYYSSGEATPSVDGKFSVSCFLCVVKNDLKGALIGFIAGNCICSKWIHVSDPRICGAIGATIFGALYSWAAKVCPDVCKKCKKPNPSSYPSWICTLPFLYWP